MILTIVETLIKVYINSPLCQATESANRSLLRMHKS